MAQVNVSFCKKFSTVNNVASPRPTAMSAGNFPISSYRPDMRLDMTECMCCHACADVVRSLCKGPEQAAAVASNLVYLKLHCIPAAAVLHSVTLMCK